MNKQIHGKQCTIIWHVDDLKISHVEENVIEDIIQCLNERFGKESPLTTSGKVLEYLGLTLNYSKCGRVKISMYEYVKKISGGSTRGHVRSDQDTNRQSSVYNQSGL